MAFKFNDLYYLQDVLGVVQSEGDGLPQLNGNNHRRAFVVEPQDQGMDDDATDSNSLPPDDNEDQERVPFDELVRQSLQSIVDTGADMRDFLRQATPLLDPLCAILRSHQATQDES